MPARFGFKRSNSEDDLARRYPHAAHGQQPVYPYYPHAPHHPAHPAAPPPAHPPHPAQGYPAPYGYPAYGHAPPPTSPYAPPADWPRWAQPTAPARSPRTPIIPLRQGASPQPQHIEPGPCPLLDTHNDETPRVLWDVRFPPSAARLDTDTPARLTARYASMPAVHPMQRRIHLVCKLLPWAIDVRNPDGVTCEDVLKAIHATLQETVTSPEWWIARKSMREKVQEAYRLNCTKGEGDGKRSTKDGIKRVDWLLDETWVLGLEKDQGFIDDRVYDKKLHPFTWVLVMSAAPEES